MRSLLILSMTCLSACVCGPVDTRDGGTPRDASTGGASGTGGGTAGGTATGGAGGGSGGAGCLAPRQQCNGACVDVKLDGTNCGSCGVTCSATESCSLGTCRPKDCAQTDCAADQVCVNGACRHVACGTMQCATNTTCYQGDCIPNDCFEGAACAAGLTCVNGSCADVPCLGVTCPSGRACRQGQCEVVGGCDGGVCCTAGEGASCGAATGCQASVCRSNACVTEMRSNGAVCAEATVCRPAGYCRSGVCEQPSATTCGTGDIQVSLTWDTAGLDMELHLIRPGGRINDMAGRSDCTWTTCISSSPDWGVMGSTADDPHKDVDNTGTLGPENIFLNSPEAGSYAVLVEHWGSGTPSNVQVIITVRGVSQTFTKTNLASHFVWDVARINGATNAVTPAGLTTDCTGSWSSGCTLPLP